MEREPDWCIVKYINTDTNYDDEGNEHPPERPYDLLILREYQWEAQARDYRHKWEYLARGLKSNEDALKWVSLFKE
jgi:hypothetical protein